jgi:hypothetical protein
MTRRIVFRIASHSHVFTDLLIEEGRTCAAG